MSQGNLVASLLLRYGKKRFPSVPGTKKTRRLASVRRGVETGLIMDELHSQTFGIGTEIFQIGLIRDIRHRDMNGHHRKLRLENPRTFCQQFEQSQRILSTRQSHQNLVIVLQESIFHHPFVEPLSDASHQYVFFGKSSHIFVSNRVQNYTKRMILEKIKEIELPEP